MKCDLLTKKDVVATINCQQAVLLPELTRRMLHGWGCRWLAKVNSLLVPWVLRLHFLLVFPMGIFFRR